MLYIARYEKDFVFCKQRVIVNKQKQGFFNVPHVHVDIGFKGERILQERRKVEFKKSYFSQGRMEVVGGTLTGVHLRNKEPQ